PEIAQAYGLPMAWGVYVQDVEPGSPAAEAGLLPGDILTAIGADVISADVSFINALIRHRIDEQTTLTVWREGETLTLNVVLKAR
ncbi:MAG TPA: PDZ domain-containing protein, partial [Anaerolineae bacterium]|nr:PDZ domain-containing protein [Anaerolineae bacterium]